MAKTSKRRKIIVFSLIGLVLAGLGGVAFFHKREAVVTIQTEKVVRRDLTEKVVANGKIQPVLQVKISPEVSGEIIDLPVKEGQSVKKGDLLVKIKPDFYIAQIHQCQAGYESALPEKRRLKPTSRKPKRILSATKTSGNTSSFRNPIMSGSRPPMTSPRPRSTARCIRSKAPKPLSPAPRILWTRPPLSHP